MASDPLLIPIITLFNPYRRSHVQHRHDRHLMTMTACQSIHTLHMPANFRINFVRWPRILINEHTLREGGRGVHGSKSRPYQTLAIDVVGGCSRARLYIYIYIYIMHIFVCDQHYYEQKEQIRLGVTRFRHVIITAGPRSIFRDARIELY